MAGVGDGGVEARGDAVELGLNCGELRCERRRLGGGRGGGGLLLPEGDDALGGGLCDVRGPLSNCAGSRPSVCARGALGRCSSSGEQPRLRAERDGARWRELRVASSEGLGGDGRPARPIVHFHRRMRYRDDSTEGTHTPLRNLNPFSARQPPPSHNQLIPHAHHPPCEHSLLIACTCRLLPSRRVDHLPCARVAEPSPSSSQPLSSTPQ